MIRAASIQNTWGAALIDGHAVNSGGDFKTKGVGFCKAQSGCEIAGERASERRRTRVLWIQGGPWRFWA
jgi:hypothetical protein